jgi:carbonic anhydrase
MRPHMRELANGQCPETLFITCADSRIVPNVITSSGPGDLFTMRNVGNLIPTADEDASTHAAIAFALDKLKVSSIVVSGHSSCEAMTALMSAPGTEIGRADAYLRPWLAHGVPTLTAFGNGRHSVAQSAAEAGFEPVDQLSMVNVAVQIDTLINHPLVADAHREGRLEVTGGAATQCKLRCPSIGKTRPKATATAIRLGPTDLWPVLVAGPVLLRLARRHVRTRGDDT